MNFFQLVLKQMRQRALATWLTLFSVMLGVSLAIAILVLGRESAELFGQRSYGYDVLVGIKASKLQLVLNTVYNMDQSPGNIKYEYYNELKYGRLKGYVKIAVPIVVGDTLDGKYRIIGTLPNLFGRDNADITKRLPEDQVLCYKPGQRFQIAEGDVFAANKFEAIVGSDIPRLAGKKIGDKFQATHGRPATGTPAAIHPEWWTIVGVLKPTHTAADTAVYIPLITFYTIAEHGRGMRGGGRLKAGELPPDEPDVNAPVQRDSDGNEIHTNYTKYVKDTVEKDPVEGDVTHKKDTIKINLTNLPIEDWAISAVMVESYGGVTGPGLMYAINNSGTDEMACNPAAEMRQFINLFLAPSQLMLLLICSLVTIVAAVGILVSIYNSVSARLKEIAILRALGATRQTVLTLICMEAGIIAFVGAVIGLLAGHLLCGIASFYMAQSFGQGIDWITPGWLELAYIAGVVILALIAGLIPALKAYRTPVATHPVAG